MTLVSHSRRFVYLKTVKTAGTSAEAVLERYCAPPERLRDPDRTAPVVTREGVIAPRRERRPDDDWWSHMPAEEVRARIGPECWERYLKVVSIRNPFDRLASWFFYAGDGERIRAMADRGGAALQRYFARWLERRGEALAVDRAQYVIHGALVVDRVIRFESLQADLRALLEELGEEAAAAVEVTALKANPSRLVADYRDLYNDGARAFVEDRFAFELERFGYRF